jgi:lysyl-tRNA synthetase class 2
MLRRAREYFAATDAIEVETPSLVRATVTDVHLESLEVRHAGGGHAGFLHTSPEYAMKRLLCAGAPDIYQVSHVFRDGERGRLHNPEFTMIEWYRLGIDHHALMADVERLLLRMFEGLVSPEASSHVTYGGAFEASLGVDPVGGTVRELASALAARGADVPAALAGERDALCDLGLSLYVAPSFPADRITFLRLPASQACWRGSKDRSPPGSGALWERSSGGFDDWAMRPSRPRALRQMPGARTNRPPELRQTRFLAALGWAPAMLGRRSATAS